MEVLSPFAKMSKKERIEFLYADLDSRNLADESTIEADKKRDILQIDSDKNKATKKLKNKTSRVA